MVISNPTYVAYVATLPCEILMSESKQLTINYKGSVATYLRCGEVVNNEIKKGLLLSVSEKNQNR